MIRELGKLQIIRVRDFRSSEENHIEHEYFLFPSRILIDRTETLQFYRQRLVTLLIGRFYELQVLITCSDHKKSSLVRGCFKGPESLELAMTASHSNNGKPKASKGASPIGFLHDADARHDIKLVQLRLESNPDDYSTEFNQLAVIGAWWSLLEVMRQQGPTIKNDPKLIAHLLSIREADAQAMLKQMLKHRLIVASSDSNFIHSPSLSERIEDYLEKKRKRQEAGRKGGKSKRKSGESNAKAMLKQVQVKKSKVKEREVKESKGKKIPPKDQPDTHLHGEHVYLTDRQHSLVQQRYKKEFDDRAGDAFDRGVEILDGYLANNPAKRTPGKDCYSDHRAVLTGWVLQKVHEYFRAAGTPAQPKKRKSYVQRLEEGEFD